LRRASEITIRVSTHQKVEEGGIFNTADYKDDQLLWRNVKQRDSPNQS